MIPRRMRIDFKGAPLHWSKVPEFATTMNASSPIASAFEPYLNKVMATVRDTLPAGKEAVRRDIDLFIAQEGHHYRLHNIFNKELYAAYPKLKQFEIELAGAHKQQLVSRSLKFNQAYCVGFENLACYMAKFTFAKARPYYEDSDRRVSTLFLWHNAEEFEHRGACNNALKAISGNYFLRIYGFLASMRRIMSYHKKMGHYMLEVDRATLTPEQRAASIRAEKEYNRRFARYVFPRMLQIFLPFYNPEKQTAPRSLHEALKDYEQLALSPEPLTA